ncbi:stimulated by retinoic acid gene 6 protein-like [Nematostella vectensis]|uniref:stimulated by retinoic acid gene 6 protein-like n=1 Tax=Nematostella vectensis TaxID=45351 RepID=UPI0020775C4C|nr:stimulated by retinoic acid gene 6 protein-like [Nematostella vectensis]
MSGPSISGETLADIIIKTAVNFPDLVRNRTVSEIFSVIAQNDTLLYAVANVTGLEPEAIERTIVVFLKVIPFMKAYRPDRADSTVIQNFTNTSCVPVPTRGEFTNLCLVPALMIIILLSLLNQRIHLVKKCGLTITRPGLCIPVNLLDSYENRFGHACAFGATINRCLDILFFSDYSQIFDAEVVAMQNDPSTPSWAGLFWRILAMLVIGVAYYPFFACLATDYKIVGGFIGLFYSAAWLATMVSQMAQCPLRYETLIFPGDLLAIDLPTYLCLFFLMLKFLFYVIRGLVKHFRRKHTVTSEECEEEDWMGCYKSKYVLKLLEPIPKELRNPDRTTFKDKLKSTVYKWKPDRRRVRRPCRLPVLLLHAAI